MSTSERPRVALVRGASRRDGVRAALDVLRVELAPLVRGTVLIKPNLGCGIIPKQRAATHADALRGVLDFVVSCAPERVLVAEGGQDAAAKYQAFGFEAVVREYGARFVDLNEESRWEPLTVADLRGGQLRVGMSRTVLEADCRISLAMPKTHDLVVASLSLKNMMGCLRRAECKHMHGVTEDQWWHRAIPSGLRRAVAAAAPAAGHLLRRSISRVQRASGEFTGGICDPRYGMPPGSRPPEMVAHLSRVLSANLAALAARLAPHVSVIDGFTGLEGEGPTAGDAVDFGVSLAGRDFAAVDATTARLMGFDPAVIEYLHLVAARGLGTTAEGGIELVAEHAVDGPVRRFRPHPDLAGQLRWRQA